MSTTTPPLSADLLRLRTEVSLAGRLVAPSWPIGTFIAVNPLGGLEDLPFDDAVATARDALGVRGHLPQERLRQAFAQGRVTRADLERALERRHPGALAHPDVVVGERRLSAADVLLDDLLHGPGDWAPVPPARDEVDDAVDAHAARWCAAYVDTGQAAWAMPDRAQGLYAAWRAVGPHDRTLPRRARARLAAAPATADRALLDALALLGVPATGRRAHLQRHLSGMPGWASHLRWRADHGDPEVLLEYLALRTQCEAALRDGAQVPAPPVRDAGPAPTAQERAAALADRLDAGPDREPIARILADLPVAARAGVWLEAYEEHHRAPLVAAMSGPGTARPAERPAAQVVCCIDARSEGLRRHLEHVGPNETLGFAGFFAAAIRFRDLGDGATADLCPVLLEPRNEVREGPAPGAVHPAARELAGRRALAGAQDAFHAAKDDMAAPFALAEAGGWIAGPIAAVRTFAAGAFGRARAAGARRAAPPAPTTLDVAAGFTLDERSLTAQAALTMMGLTENLARVVLFCAHGSHTENNPYAAALACGACGGQAGGPNARAAVAMLNDPEVREVLAERGIEIPPDTWFVAGEHDTATDVVRILDEHLVPEGHRPDVARLAADLAAAGRALRAERAVLLPGAAPTDDDGVLARGTDWAQVFPEWGLAGNAAFIVGPREMTAGLDLERRCFLHSYRAEVDTDGTALETILTAPLVVAQWINLQYYCSTVDPEVFGSGTKTIHNVVGGIGVLSGQDGDLRLGLPWQSVADGDTLVHEPMRLLAVVQAPLERIDEIIARNPILQRLFGGGWVALTAREHPGEPWRRLRDGAWVPESAPPPPSPSPTHEREELLR